MEKIRESITISWEINKKKNKNKRENVENWLMMWLNESVIAINTILHLSCILHGFEHTYQHFVGALSICGEIIQSSW